VNIKDKYNNTALLYGIIIDNRSFEEFDYKILFQQQLSTKNQNLSI
jgi:hypothetical protein